MFQGGVEQPRRTTTDQRTTKPSGVATVVSLSPWGPAQSDAHADQMTDQLNAHEMS